MLKICLLCTEYQKKIFLAILAQTKQNKNDFIFILSGSLYHVEGAKNVYRVQEKDRKFSFSEARSLVKEVWQYIVQTTKKENYSLWLASDGHPVGQILLNNNQCQSINVFEDGLGSYVSYDFFDFDRSLINIIARIRNWIYLYPTFRATRACGNYKSVESSWACAEIAFPWLSSEVQVIGQKYLSSQFDSSVDFAFELHQAEKILFFLDQPIIEDKILSVVDYRNSILVALVELVGQTDNLDKIFVKNHPRSDAETFLETVNFLQKHLGIPVEACMVDCNFETLFLFLEKKYVNMKFIIASSFSTALYTTKIFHPKIDVFCIFDQALIKKQKQGSFLLRYIKALEKFGIKLITIN